MNIFEQIDEYRTQVIEVLKKNNKYYDNSLTNYTTPSKKFSINYYKWNHPYQGTWEYTEIFTDNIMSYLKNTLNPDSVVIDVGAQAGLMSVLYAQFVKKVISFEPNPVCYEVLKNNATIYKNIIPYNFACSTEDGPLTFHYSDEALCNGGFAENCKKGIGVTGHVYPLDVYAVNLLSFLETYHAADIDDISLIKIDTEGHDKDIIKSIEKTIQNINPILIAEMYAGLTDVEVSELIDVIKYNNYHIYDITKDNSGIGIIEKRRKINGVTDVSVGQLCNFLCLPIHDIRQKKNYKI